MIGTRVMAAVVGAGVIAGGAIAIPGGGRSHSGARPAAEPSIARHDLPAQPTPVGPTGGAERIRFSLQLAQPRRAEQQRYLAGLNTPGSPYYHQFISAAEFGKRFGIPNSQLSRVRAVLTRAGLQVTAAYPQRTQLEVTGTAATVASYLGVRFADFRGANGKLFHRAIGSPAVPHAIAGPVTAVTGLSDAPFFHKAAVPLGGLKPKDVAAAYNVKPLLDRGLTGKGQTVAIVSFDSFHDEDVADYDRQIGIAGAPRVEHVPVRGRIPVGEGQDEVNLDIDVIRGLAPQATILNYEAPNTLDGLAAVFNKIAQDGRADIVSVSWGGCALLYPPAQRQADERALATLAARGIPMFVASGDSGAYECQRNDPQDQRLAVVWPSASPSVTSVGGTTLDIRQNGGYAEEFGWEEVLSQAGGGGGVDLVAQRPSWQKGKGVDNSDSTGKRQLPDVSASADPASGFFVYLGGKAKQVGGTSAAAPFWAASMTLIAELAAQRKLGKLGFVNPMLYELAQGQGSPFHDVTRGGNRHYDAGPGWDYSTGLGSPDIARLADATMGYLKSHKK